MSTESCVAIAYTIRYGRENNATPELPAESVIESFASSGNCVSESTIGGGSAEIVPSEDVSMVRFSVALGGPVRSL